MSGSVSLTESGGGPPGGDFLRDVVAHTGKHTAAVTNNASDFSGRAVFYSGNMRHPDGMALSGLKKARKAKGMTQAALAEALGVEPPTVSRWEAGDRQPDSETLRRVAVLLGTTVGAIFDETPLPPSEVLPAPGVTAPSWRMPSDVPVYGTALGAEIEFGQNGASIAVEATIIEPTQTLGYLRRPPVLQGRAGIYAVYVAGSSMEPRYGPGDKVYVDPKRPPGIGDDVIVQLRDHAGVDGEDVYSALIKTLVKRSAGGVRLKQYNPAGEFFVASTDIVHIHRVVPWQELLGE